MALRNQPYLPLYVQDFMTDEKLAECSAAATGVYIRIMCLMHKSEQYGKILLKQKYKQTDSTCRNFALMFVRQLPYDLVEIEHSLVELTEENVLHIEGDSLIQKRMLKDGEVSEKRVKAGRKGGNPSLGKTSKFGYPKVKANSEANAENENEYHTLNKEEEFNNNNKEKIDSSYLEQTTEISIIPPQENVKLSPHAYQPERSLEDCKAELLTDRYWLEQVSMNNGLKDIRDTEVWLVKFFSTLSADGLSTKGLSDAKKHFNRWLKLELQKNKTNGNIKSSNSQSLAIPAEDYKERF